MPWIALFDPQVRLAFAETAGIAVLPLAFLAADLGKGRPLWLFFGTALTTGLLTLMHVPTMVANSGVLLTYAALAERSVRATIRSTLAVIAGVGFGLAMAGYMLVPALVLLPSITSAAFWDAEHRPDGNYFLTLESLRSQLGILSDICVLAPLLLAVLVGARGLRAGRIPVNLVGSLSVACFFLLPLSSLFWNHLLPLRMVQFPGRFMPSVSLLASSIIALSLPGCRAGVQRLVIGVAWAMGVFAVVFAMYYGDGASPGRKRTADATVQWRANAPEYVPEAAASKGWFERMPDPEAFQEQLERMRSPCVSGVSALDGATDGRQTFDVSHCSGPVVLPVFFFPGWTARSDDGQRLTVRADDKSGLVTVDLPSQAERITLRRSPTQIELIGSLTSLLSISILAGFAVGVLRPKHAHPA
ncbi:MAG: hypothetical protein JOZ42_02360 [Acetobacteraceae bacterium]|nr:hypothetical protein [Acetobacteraceae bacterium]